MFLRLAAVVALIIALMAVIADGRVLARAGLVGHCTAVQARAGDESAWQVCRPGRLEGRPDLTDKGCLSQGVRGQAEYWRCPAAIVVSQAPRD